MRKMNSNHARTRIWLLAALMVGVLLTCQALAQQAPATTNPRERPSSPRRVLAIPREPSRALASPVVPKGTWKA